MSGAISMVAWDVLEYLPASARPRLDLQGKINFDYEADTRAREILDLVTEEFT